jgi:hypothetical protein
MEGPGEQLFSPPSRMKRCPDCQQWKPETEFPRNKNYRDGRHPYCKPCHNARGKESKQRLYGGSRHYHLMRRYGIGADEVDTLVAAQGGMCAICGKRNPEHVDHDHATGVVRGILCFNCNGGLGQFRDSTDALRAAAVYLEQRASEVVALRELAVRRAGELGTTSV